MSKSYDYFSVTDNNINREYGEGIIMKNTKYVEFFYSAGAFVGGAALFGVAMNMFLSPGKIVMGGATGIATTVNHLFESIPIGIMIMAINVPLLLLNLKQIGTGAMLRATAGIVASSTAIDLMTFLPVTLDEPLLCAVLGGVTMGAGAGLMLTRGFSTGGSDLAALMLKKHIKSLTTGRIILIIDAAIVLGSAVIMKSYESIIYSAVSIFAYSAAIDAVMGGSDRAKLVIIVSHHYEAIADAVAKRLSRGVTVLHGNGWYTKENREVLMCVVKRQEGYLLKTIVENTDPDAFMILSDATEVLGVGFKAIVESADAGGKARLEKKKHRRELRQAEKTELREPKRKGK